MQVINASRLLAAGFQAAGHRFDATAVASRVIYSNPTPHKLADYLYRTLQHGGKAPEYDEQHEFQAMQVQFQRYARDLLTAPNRKAEAADKDQSVILTGSTGMLGSYLLDRMASTPAVNKVVCLNRAEDGGVAQNAQRGSRTRARSSSWW